MLRLLLFRAGDAVLQMIMFNEYISSQVYKAQHESDRVRKRTPGLVYGCGSPASCTCSDGWLPSFAVLKNRSPHSCNSSSHHDFPAPYLGPAFELFLCRLVPSLCHRSDSNFEMLDIIVVVC